MTTTCPRCGHPNREGRRFCAECGTALAPPSCPSCDADNEFGEKFCGDCGAPLVPASTAAQPSPPPFATAGEKKHITVLFADVAGSMDLQEELDPEVWAKIMGRFVAILAEGVRKYGGTVDKFTGDGIMALFGAPVAQEDHARRACHAAWQLTRAIGGYSEELRKTQGVELGVRLGLNSGEVVVGRVGEDVTLDPTALGHTVGLAQRMEAMAAPGTAYLTGHTARLVEGWFQLDGLGPRAVKGSRAPLEIYELAGPSPSPPVLRSGWAVGGAAMVGRQRELAVLEDALRRAMEGTFQVVGIVGDAGVGKSRLCDEFARSVATRGITVRRTAGLAHGKEVPLLPILSFLRDYFGVTDSDPLQQAREKIGGRLLDLDPALGEALPLILDLLEVPDTGRPAPRLTPEVRMRRIFEALREITQRRSEREVLVLVLEDLHWFDAQSEAFLEQVIPSFRGTRTLVLTNFRPPFAPPWSAHSSYCQLPLRPLDTAAASQLLHSLLGEDPSPAGLIELIIDRTAGNPFFIEEVVRSLVDNGTLAGQQGAYRLARPIEGIRVPLTIQATLAARIDRLPATSKELLQTAAVIGRSFPEAILRQVSGLADVAAGVEELCAAEFLDVVATGAEYRFWHPLTQEVAYRSLLTERRKRLHGRVAGALIEYDPDRLDERAALIAGHFEQAEDHLEAARWNERAGGFGLRTDVGEAMRRWRATLDHLDSAPETEETAGLGIRVRNRLIRYGARTGMSLDEAGRLYADARSLAERLGDPNQLASVTFAYGSTSLWRGAVREGLDRYLEAAHLSEQADDTNAQACYWAPACVVFSRTGPVSEGLRVAEDVGNLCGGNPDVGVSVLGFSILSGLGVARADLLVLCGRVDDARAALDGSLRIARERGDTEWIAWGLSVYPRLARTPEELEESLERAHEAIRVAEDSGHTSNHVLALEAVGIAEIGLERFPEAVDNLERALGEARQAQVGLFEEATTLAHLARAHLGQGQLEAARQRADEAVAVARRQGAHVVELLAVLTRAQVQRVAGNDTDYVLADLDGAGELVEQTGAVSYEPFIHEELGRLHHDEKELREALRLYRQIGAEGHARRLEAELSAAGMSGR